VGKRGYGRGENSQTVQDKKGGKNATGGKDSLRSEKKERGLFSDGLFCAVRRRKVSGELVPAAGAHLPPRRTLRPASVRLRKRKGHGDQEGDS